MRFLFNKLLDVIFPPICLSCRKNLDKENTSLFNKNICVDCAQKIEIASGFLCPKCLRRLPEPKNPCHPETKFILGAASSYQNAVVREIIHSLKYQKIKAAAEVLSQILELYFEKISGDFENFIVIPVPLYPKKQKQRGFNQSLLIAEALAKKMNLSGLQTDVLIKTKNTESQTQLQDFEKREQNVLGSFAIKNPELIKNKNIILIDDVFTSGATMKEAVKVLKSAGAKKIIALVVARA